MKVMSWLVPVVCFVLAGGLVYWQYRRMELAAEERARTQQAIESLQTSIDQSANSEVRERIPSVADTRLEEAMFLDSVRELALLHNVRLEKWRNERETAPTAEADRKEQQKPESVRRVRTLASTVEVAGPFEGVRGFVDDLLSGRRLLTIKSGAWLRLAAGQTKFNFKLHRYVTDAATAGAEAAGPGVNVQTRAP